MTSLEQDLQKKIINFLKSLDWYVVKVISANHAGVPDLICCAPTGLFVGIEVKRKGNNTTKLQDYNLEEIGRKGGVSFSCKSMEELKAQLVKNYLL